MQTIVESGAIVTVMLVFVIVEVIALIAYRRFTGRGLSPLGLLLNIGAGTSLMFALRASLMNQSWQIIAVWLVIALIFHMSDLVYRYRALGRQ